MIPEVRNHHCRSELDVSERVLTLHINCFESERGVYTQTSRGPNNNLLTTTYSTTTVTDINRTNFKAAFIASVNEHWNGKLWIGTSVPSSLDPISCAVQLQFVDNATHAHLHMAMLHNPQPASGPTVAFRSNCNLAGRSNTNADDMDLAFPLNGSASHTVFDVERRRMPTSDRGEQPFTQNTAAHEFGHYLGLNHTCFSAATSNAAADYCHERSQALQDRVMSLGNVVTGVEGQPWLDRLRRHHYHNDVSWYAFTEEARLDSGLMDSIARGH